MNEQQANDIITSLKFIHGTLQNLVTFQQDIAKSLRKIADHLEAEGKRPI